MLTQRQIPDKGSEIHELAPLIDPLDLHGTVVTIDALHTQRDTACHLAGVLDWREVRREVGEYVAWLRLPPTGRDGQVAVLPSVQPNLAASTINRKCRRWRRSMPIRCATSTRKRPGRPRAVRG